MKGLPHLLNTTIIYFIIVMENILTKSRAQNFTCTSLFCENDSLCKTIVYRSNGEEQSHAQCICHGSFTGPRCEARIRLFTDKIKSRSVHLGISFEKTNKSSVSSETVLEDYLVYSLHYWNNKSSKSCSVITQSSLRNFVISGLQPETEYTFCANTDAFMRWCPVENTTNCLVLRTYSAMADEPFPPYVVPVVIIVVVLLTVLIVTVLVLRKKHCMTSKEHSQIYENQSLQSRRKRYKKKDKHRDLFLLPGSPSSERLQINPPSSPGRPKHSLSTQSYGYASFSAKNDKAIALKTVLEYVPNDQNDQSEPFIILHETNSPS